MKLSVLIPMYNAETYISNCLNSLVNQDLESNDYEIIIMDDGSTDDSLKIVKAFARRYRNIFLYAEKNSGSDSTRNKLLKLAKGEYIYFLDSDDYIVHNALGRLLNYLEKHKLDFLGFNTLETKKLSLFRLKEPLGTADFSPIQTGLEYIRDNKHLRHEVWWYIIKRNIIYNNAIAFDDNGNNADVVFTLKLLLKTNKLSYLSIPIHRYVESDESVMRGKTAEQKRKLTDSMFLMIISYSNLINKLIDKPFDDKKNILNNLKHRRDVFVFFNIVNMIRTHYSYNDIKEKVSQLSLVNAYPIYCFNKHNYATFKYKMLNKIISTKHLLLVLVFIKSKLLR